MRVPILTAVVGLCLLSTCAEEGDIDLSKIESIEYFNPILRTSTTGGLVPAYVNEIVEGNDGSIWFGTDSGISRLRDGEVEVMIGDEYEYCLSSMTDSRGNVWFGTLDGAIYFDGGSWKRVFEEYSFIYVESLLEDSSGRIWLGTEEYGIAIVENLATPVITYLYDPTCDKCNDVYSLLDDTHGNIWVGTGEDLRKYSQGEFSIYSIAAGLPKTKINALLEDTWNILWVATDRGMYRSFDKVHFERWIVLGLEDKYSRGSFSAAALDFRDRLWLGTNISGLVYFDGLIVKSVIPKPDFEPFKFMNVNSLFLDSKKNLWAGTDGGAIKINRP